MSRMAPGVMHDRRPRIISPEYEPATGFIEIRPNVYAPSDWVPGPYELPEPSCATEAEMAEEYGRCKASAAYFILKHCWSVHVDDPSGHPQWRRFPAYPYMRVFFRDAQTVANTLCEKSRQMMMSWNWMALFLWDITFHDNWNNLLISRREIEVDDGGYQATHSSLIGKVRHIHMALPPYLQANIDFQYGMVRHKDANSFIRGETGTTKAGRGAVVKRALVDEAAFIEHSPTVFASVRNVAKIGTILNSTANGKDNEFARIRFSSTTTFKKFTFKWIDHPEKAKGLYCTCGWTSVWPSATPLADQFRAHDCANLKIPDRPLPPEARSPWYDKEARDLTPEQMASEVDISYERSTRGRVWPFFDAVRHTFDHTQVKVGDGVLGPPRVNEPLEAYRQRYLRAVLEPYRPTIVGWDFGVSDPTSLVLGQVMNEETMAVRWVDEFEAAGESWEFFHKFVMATWAPAALEATGYDLIHYGDPSGKNRESDLQSWISNLQNFAEPSRRIVVIHLPKIGSRLDWLDFVGNLIRLDQFEVSTWCSHLIDTIQQYKFPTDPNTGEPIPGKQEPVHNKWSHCFVGETQVLTSDGHHRIDQIGAGDVVWTRGGWNRVLVSGLTQYQADVFSVTLSDGRVVTATPEQRFWVAGKGWTCLSALRYDDHLCVESNEKPLYSTASNSTDTQTQKDERSECISLRGRMTERTASGASMLKFGSFITALFQKAISFITSAMTTRWMFLNWIAFQPSSTASDIEANARSRQSIVPNSRLESDGSRSQRLAARRQGVEQRASGRSAKAFRRVVTTVVSSILGRCRGAGFARTTASQPIDATRVWTRRIESATNAPFRTPATDGASSGPVENRVVRVERIDYAGRRDVYDLTVENCPEFFANGVLVHNCASALRYTYQFRWASRLKAVHGQSNQAGRLLRAGRGTRMGSAMVRDGRG